MTTTKTARQGLPWPTQYSAILPVLQREWGVGDQLFLTRQLGHGRSGALVYVVDIASSKFTGQAILKLDRGVNAVRQEKLESELHTQAIDDEPAFAGRHLPRVIHTVQHEDAIALLSTIAGRGLEYAEPWIDLSHTSQLEIVQRVSGSLLNVWNHGYTLSDGLLNPQDLLSGWLEYRMQPEQGGRIHDFVRDECNIAPETPSFIFNGYWYPNPLAFHDGAAPLVHGLALRAAQGHLHGDFQGYNLLCLKPEQKERSNDSDYFLIDLATYQRNGYLFYDQAYFELAILLAARGVGSVSDWEAVVMQLHRFPHEGASGMKTEDSGFIQIVQAVRGSVADWIESHEPDRLASMESQQMLARIAVGLSFVHKKSTPDLRKKALYYAAANLKDYLRLHSLDWPKQGPELAIADERQRQDPLSSRTDNVGFGSQETADRAARGPLAKKVQLPSNRIAWISMAFAFIALVFVAIEIFDLRDKLTTQDVELARNDFASDLRAAAISGSAKPSIAVMPFVGGASADDVAFADGLALEIIHELAESGKLSVPGYLSVNKLRLENASALEVGERLNVDYVVQGEVVDDGDNIRVVLEVVDATTGGLVWSDVFLQEDRKTYSLRADIARAIGEAISVPLGLTNPMDGEYIPDALAYEAYVRGIALLEQRGYAISRAMSELQRAVELDPGYAPAWAGLSIAYDIAPLFLREGAGREVNPAVYFRRSEDAALRALELDANLSEAQDAAGRMFLRESQWIRSERAYQRALDLDPTNTRAMLGYATLLQIVGKPEQAIDLIELARSLDPSNDLFLVMLARLTLQLSPSPEALFSVKKVFRETPVFAELAFRPILGASAELGELDAARELIVACNTCSQWFRSKTLQLFDTAGVISGEQLMQEYKDDSFFGYMFLYKFGNKDLVLDLFEYRMFDPYFRLQSPVPWGMIGILGKDERFTRIIKDIGIVEYWQANGWSPMCRRTAFSIDCGGDN
ncbi:MAG: tetratricopeptide repeat protein [Pseudomonadota bacterium]